MTVPVVNTITSDTIDSEGHNYIEDNRIYDVFYYDTTASGEGSWTKNYTGVSNPVASNDFSGTTVTGTGDWTDTSDDVSNALRMITVNRIPFDYENELFATYGTIHSFSTTAAGDENAVLGDWFLQGATTLTTPPRNVFPDNYGAGMASLAGGSDLWSTTSGTTNHGYFIVDLGQAREVGGFYFEGHLTGTDSSAAGNLIRDFEIDVSTTGTSEGDFTTVVSGTIPYNWVESQFYEIVPTDARYVRLIFNNHGGPQTNLGKFFAYSPAQTDEIGLLCKAIYEYDFSSSKTFELSQTVDLSGIDYLYMDIKDYVAQDTNYLEIFLDGSPVVQFSPSPDVPGQNENDYRHERGFSVDVSSYGAGTVFKLRKEYTLSTGDITTESFLAIKSIEVLPSWYTETNNSKRGAQSRFPDKVYIVSDAKGLSIINIDNDRLWMRFDYGLSKMLQQRPRRVFARSGKIYLGTSRGLFVIDFPRNCVIRYDERGEYRRYGIDKRNEDSTRRNSLDNSPYRDVYHYRVHDANNALPYNDIYDMALGEDPGLGSFVVLGTSKGLTFFDEDVGFYSSFHKEPVYTVKLKEKSVWYSQGTGTSSVIRKTEVIPSLAESNFIPEETFFQGSGMSDSFSDSSISSDWRIVNQDPGMAISEGSVLTISGSHTQTGATGLIHKHNLADRSFTAKIKAKIKEFPPDARGAVRFGFAYDYSGDGIKSLVSSSQGVGNREGIFISALNANPFKGRIPEDTSFSTGSFSDDVGWFIYSQQRNSFDNRAAGMTATSSGIRILSEGSYHFADGEYNLKRVSTTHPFEKRDFVATLQVKVEEGMVPESSTDYKNPAVVFGISENEDVIPGTYGTDEYVNPAMLLWGSTTASGTHFYTTGRFDDNGRLVPEVSAGLPPIGDDENTDAAPYREWKLDYEHSSNTITCYIDDENCGSLDEQGQAAANPPYTGITFGVERSGSSTVNNPRSCLFKEFKITYPALVSGSRNFYAVETIEDDAPFHVMSNHAPAQGLHQANNTVPSGTALASTPDLIDGDLENSAVTIAQDTSVGIDLGSQKTVESVYLYDDDASDGWNSMTNDKPVEIWTSEDNVTWSLHKEYNFTHVPRQNGLARLSFCPALETRYIQALTTGAGSSYNIPGNTSWNISEIRAMTVDGPKFFETDGTGSADFHEWKLEYDSDIRLVKGYVDGSLVTSTRVPNNMQFGNMVIMHDLTTVNSGTSSVFHGEFKDFELTFKDSNFIPQGTVNDFQINLNSYNNSNNYTLSTATSEGVGVADFQTPVYLGRLREDISGWTAFTFAGATTAGSWSLSNGVLTQTTTSAGKSGSTSGVLPYGTHFIYDNDNDPLSSRTKNLKALVKPENGGSIGVAWCRSDEENFYYFISSSDGEKIEVGRVLAGVKTVLTSGSDYLTKDRWHEILVDNTTTSDFTIYVDGRNVLSVSGETQLSSGKVALISNNNANGKYVDVGVVDNGFAADQLRTFDHSDDIFGDSENSITITSDEGAKRSQGLVLVGTSQYELSKYKTSLNRPYWYDGVVDESSDDFQYGNRISIGYHSDKDKVYFIFDKNSPYIVEMDMDNGYFNYISRMNWREALSIDTSAADFNTGSMEIIYTSLTDELWFWGSPSRLLSMDMDTLDVFVVTDELSATGEDSNYCGEYSLHNGQLVLAEQSLGRVDASTRSFLTAPENFSSTPWQWNRHDVLPYYSSSADGGQDMVYCDYDKNIYIISGSNANDTQFFRYYVDNDYLEELSAPPIESNGPENAQRLVYDPQTLRVYAITANFVNGQLAYYDVVNDEWLRLGEDGPFTARRGYPENIDEPSGGEGTTCFAIYNSSRKSIVIMGRGRDNVLYEYKPDVDNFGYRFDYVPSRDGLPSEAGIAKHFDHAEAVCSFDHSTQSSFDREYYSSLSAATADTNMILDFSNGSYITLSGSGDSQSQTVYNQYYISSAIMEAQRDVQVDFEVELPSFTTDIYQSGADAHSYFVVGLSDGVNRLWSRQLVYGQEDDGLYQSTELRVGVSGTDSSPTTHGPLSAHVVYIDGFNTDSPQVVSETASTYNSTSDVELSLPYNGFKKGKLVYTYEEDKIEGFFDNQSVGSISLRRKFNSDNGIRFHFGWRIGADESDSRGQFWAANIKNLEISAKHGQSIESNRLKTAISGTVGSVYNERWDQTLTANEDWFVDTEVYYPTNVQVSGHDYIVSIAGVGDGNKLMELVAYYDGVTKKVGIIGDLNNKDDSSTYLAGKAHLWDDISIGKYKVSKDASSGQVKVYINDSSSADLTVNYNDLPNYDYQHVYYGKTKYNIGEAIYESPTLSGTWTSSPDFTGASDPEIGKRAFNSDAHFATIVQGTAAQAEYDLGSNLGTVDLYVFYHAEGFDTAKNTPYTIYADNNDTQAAIGGAIVSISPSTDEFGNSNSSATTIRVDQRRKKDGSITFGDKNKAESSGWIHIGEFTNPTKVIVSADAEVGSSSTNGFVCADAIGVDIGNYGKSTVEMSLKHFKYNVGSSEEPTNMADGPGVSIIDLSENIRIDQYGEGTSPGLVDGNITSSDVVE